MRALINGSEGGVLSIMRGEERTHFVLLINDDGSPLTAAAADTIQLIAHAYPDRSTTAIASFPTRTYTASGLTVIGGYSYPIVETDTASLLPGTYYLFVQYTINASSKIYVAKVPFTLILR